LQIRGQRGTRPPTRKRRIGMSDFVFVAVTIVFFAVAWAYVLGCDRL
jgi:hypothetical protein